MSHKSEVRSVEFSAVSFRLTTHPILIRWKYSLEAMSKILHIRISTPFIETTLTHGGQINSVTHEGKASVLLFLVLRTVDQNILGGGKKNKIKMTKNIFIELEEKWQKALLGYFCNNM